MHIIFSKKKLNFLLTFCVKILFCRHYFSPLNTSMRKGKDPEPDPDPYLWLMDPDPGGPKTCGSPTLSRTWSDPVRKAETWKNVWPNLLLAGRVWCAGTSWVTSPRLSQRSRSVAYSGWCTHPVPTRQTRYRYCTLYSVPVHRNAKGHRRMLRVKKTILDQQCFQEYM